MVWKKVKKTMKIVKRLIHAVFSAIRLTIVFAMKSPIDTKNATSMPDSFMCINCDNVLLAEERDLLIEQPMCLDCSGTDIY